ncbi:MAG: hypothetical protein K2X74_08560, partial [Acetobacteraceae bacterium]|nr:hypothetical protein [Acetobacteraceae bacterium]
LAATAGIGAAGLGAEGDLDGAGFGAAPDADTAGFAEAAGVAVAGLGTAMGIAVADLGTAAGVAVAGLGTAAGVDGAGFGAAGGADGAGLAEVAAGDLAGVAAVAGFALRGAAAVDFEADLAVAVTRVGFAGAASARFALIALAALPASMRGGRTGAAALAATTARARGGFAVPRVCAFLAGFGIAADAREGFEGFATLRAGGAALRDAAAFFAGAFAGLAAVPLPGRLLFAFARAGAFMSQLPYSGSHHRISMPGPSCPTWRRHAAPAGRACSGPTPGGPRQMGMRTPTCQSSLMPSA